MLKNICVCVKNETMIYFANDTILLKVDHFMISGSLLDPSVLAAK